MSKLITSELERKYLPILASEMKLAGLDPVIISEAEKIAQTDASVYDIMLLWKQAKNPLAKYELFIELKATVKDNASP